jgi:hypothetical protein
LNARRAACERQQSDVARTLDRHAQPPLVTRTHTRHAARQNLSALLHELRQNVRALVVNEVHLLDAKLANLLLAEILPLSARTSARPAWTSRSTATRSAFAPRTAVPTARSAMTSMAARSTFTPRRSARSLCLFLIL